MGGIATPILINPPYDWPALHGLIAGAFAYMDGRIDPPSSIARLREADLEAHAIAHDLWVIEADGRPVACALGEFRGDRYYIGKLAVAAAYRGQGLARAIIAACAARAKGRAVALQLQTRIELVENHAVFARLGFVIVAQTAHPGYARPTSITMERAI